ncbi:Hercynylcysteine sulfoxide lyase [Psilocybe cubensis]|uniref:Hercynylcysteine sulfoxide lyase n=2 Tax=Psilocybe cubensis TaxID=181762 RepID=A0ACB8GU37_PSICU|nr:Hercynylcysteine sulfoxide lyase [Psilocybe cubensis]KAH9479109.1 Hercynylcysteine sulfoxide lyase [Psilocybe cubensis]
MTQLDSQSYKQDTPVFGHNMLQYYTLDPDYINLNNGSYGTTPLPVQRAVVELQAKIESKPDLFHRVLFQPMLIEVRERLASLIGAKTDEVVLVTNASMGLNVVLRNIDWEEGDIIIAFTTTYNSISRTAAYLSDKPPHPTITVIDLAFPMTHNDIINKFKAHLEAHPAKPNKKRVAIIDSIVSNPGVLLPWQELVNICKDSGVWSVVDAAHSIGQEVGLNLSEIAPDFWISNCHKWLSAKRSCAVLYVPERNQHIVRSSIPTSAYYISPQDRHGQPNFVKQYEWNGTIDYTAYLTVKDALEFRNWMGGEEKINDYCHNLAITGGRRMAEIMETEVMDPSGELTLNMVNVELPLPGDVSEAVGTKMHASLQHKMLLEQNAYSAHFYHNGRWWTRCSAQVWNELDDFEKIAQKWVQACKEVKEELGLGDGK